MICPAACTHPKACTACAVLLACRSCSRRSPNAAPDGQCLRCHRPARVALSAHYEPVAASAPAPTVPGPLPRVLEPRNASTGTDPVALRLSRRRAVRARYDLPALASAPDADARIRDLEGELAEAQQLPAELGRELERATERVKELEAEVKANDELITELEDEKSKLEGQVQDGVDGAAQYLAEVTAWALEAGAEAWAVIPRLSGGAARVVQLQALGVTPAGSAVEAAALFGGAA